MESKAPIWIRFLSAVLLNLDNLHFDNCWANISYPGDYIFPHNHNGSLLSGVYYVKSSINERIKFFNKPTMLPDPEVWNNYNHQYCEYSCIPGSMLLFTSDTMHGTEKQKCEEKIALSFNLSLWKNLLFPKNLQILLLVGI